MHPSLRLALRLGWLAWASLMLASCGTTADVINYTVVTNNRLACCRSMSFTVATFAPTARVAESSEGVVVRFVSSTIAGGCDDGAESPIAIENHTDKDIYIPTSHELEGDRIKLYPWRQHHDSGRGAIRLARQIQYGDLLERDNDSRLRLMRLPAGHEVRLRAWVPGAWLCTKPTELYEGYLAAELDPTFYAQRARGLRASPYEQAKELVSPIPLQYDVVWVTLDFLQTLPVISRAVSDRGDTITMHLNVNEEPAAFLNAEQKVSSSNIIEMVINR